MKYKLLIIIGLLVNPYFGIAQKNLFLQAKVTFEKGEYEQSVKFLDNYIVEYPNNQSALFLRAKINLELNHYQLTLKDLNKLRKTYHNDILLLKARAYAGLENSKEAIEKLEDYLDKPNKQPTPIIQSYKEFQGLKASMEWKSLWNKEHYSKKEHLLNNAIYAIKSQKYEEANERLDELLNRYSKSEQGHYLKGSLLYLAQNYQSALKQYKSVVELEDDNLDYQLGVANCYTKLKKGRKAIELYNQVLKQDSLYIDAYKGRAEAYLINNNVEKAENDIAKYRLYYPDNLEAKYLNAAINVKSGDFLSAISAYGKLIKENPGRADYFIGRANSYMATKTYKYAIKDFSMALDLEPKNIEIYKQKALAHKLAGEMKKACIEWQHAAKLGDVDSMDMLHKYCK